MYDWLFLTAILVVIFEEQDISAPPFGHNHFGAHPLGAGTFEC